MGRLELLEKMHNALVKRLEDLEELAKERAHLINAKTYLDLADRVTKLENDDDKKCEELKNELSLLTQRMINYDQDIWKYIKEREEKWPIKCPNCKNIFIVATPIKS